MAMRYNFAGGHSRAKNIDFSKYLSESRSLIVQKIQNEWLTANRISNLSDARQLPGLD